MPCLPFDDGLICHALPFQPHLFGDPVGRAHLTCSLMSTPKAFKGITPPERGSGSRSSRNFGVFLAILAVLISAPDGCLLRSIQVRGGGKNLNLQIFALKFLMAAPMQLCWVLYERGVNVCWRGTCSCWQWVILGSLFTVGAALVTIANLESTSVSALLFFYVAPLWALVMGVFYMQEALQRRTVVAVVIACAGVGLLFVPSFLHRNDPHPVLAGADAARHAPSLWGDILGLFSGICMAGCAKPSACAQPSAPVLLARLTCVDGSSTEHVVPCRSPCNSLADGSSPNAVRSPNCPLCLALAAISRRAGTRVSTLRRLRWCSALPSARCSRGCWG